MKKLVFLSALFAVAATAHAQSNREKTFRHVRVGLCTSQLLTSATLPDKSGLGISFGFGSSGQRASEKYFDRGVEFDFLGYNGLTYETQWSDPRIGRSYSTGTHTSFFLLYHAGYQYLFGLNKGSGLLKFFAGPKMNFDGILYSEIPQDSGPIAGNEASARMRLCFFAPSLGIRTAVEIGDNRSGLVFFGEAALTPSLWKFRYTDWPPDRAWVFPLRAGVQINISGKESLAVMKSKRSKSS